METHPKPTMPLKACQYDDDDLQCLMITLMWLFVPPGFVNVRLEEEKPIFNKQRIDFSPPEKINHFAVCNNQLCMSLGKDTLLRQVTLYQHRYFICDMFEGKMCCCSICKVMGLCVMIIVHTHSNVWPWLCSHWLVHNGITKGMMEYSWGQFSTWVTIDVSSILFYQDRLGQARPAQPDWTGKERWQQST